LRLHSPSPGYSAAFCREDSAFSKGFGPTKWRGDRAVARKSEGGWGFGAIPLKIFRPAAAGLRELHSFVWVYGAAGGKKTVKIVPPTDDSLPSWSIGTPADQAGAHVAFLRELFAPGGRHVDLNSVAFGEDLHPEQVCALPPALKSKAFWKSRPGCPLW